MWRIIVANKQDNDFLFELSEKSSDEVIKNFKEIIEVFSNLRSSVFCTSAIFLVESYNATNQKLFIHYHIDSDEEAIRITTVNLE